MTLVVDARRKRRDQDPSKRLHQESMPVDAWPFHAERQAEPFANLI
jgi:hypothetical protein